MYLKKNVGELAAILALQGIKGIGPVKFKLFHEKVGSFSGVFDMAKKDLRDRLHLPPKITERVTAGKTYCSE